MIRFRDKIREAMARAELPQVPAGSHEEVVERMIRGGVEVQGADIEVDVLRPVQDGINRQKVENIKDSLQAGESMRPIVISQDGYVLDGHHRWVAMKEAGHKTIGCDVVMLPKNEALKALDFFTR